MNIVEKLGVKYQERIVGLDILRAVAILIVVYGHGAFLLPESNRALYDSANFLKIDGVSIFFVLSGFLIGGILLRIIDKTNFTKKDLMNFWIRRWFRTMPNYLIILIGLLTYRLLINKTIGDFNFKYIFFLQNFYSPHPDFFPEAWSLTIEEWFYLLFPLSCYIFLHMIKRDKVQSILVSALIFLTIPLILRIVKYENGIGIDNFDLEFRKILVLRLDSLMYGVLAAYILYKRPEFWNKYKYLFLTIGMLFVFLLNFNLKQFLYKPLSFNIESITTFCFLPFLSSYKTTKLKTLDAFFTFISIISYSMYLLNLSVVQFRVIPLMNILLRKVNVVTEHVYILNYIMYWFFTILGSYVLYRIYEKPITDFRNKVVVK